jgi:anti-anti-sigma regulatory factor
VQFARLPDGIVIIRVSGKGTHQQSSSLKHIFEATREANPTPRYVIDLDQCTTMDSTFMGTLASIGLFQRRELGSSVIVANLKEHVRYLLNTLGLQYILDLRSGLPDPSAGVGEGAFAPAQAPELSHLDRILMMIEAHERLVDIDSENEIKFEGVLKSLRDSLDQEKNRP